MTKTNPTCVKLSAYVHELLFSFAGRSYPESYFTVYQLDDGSRETRLCAFPTDPQGKDFSVYIDEMLSSLHGRSLTGFAMFLSQEDDAGIFQWWSMATDNQVNIDAARFVPFTNEDGILDYMALSANHRRPEDKEAMSPMLEATNLVWSMALDRGAADMVVDMPMPEQVQA